jgi:dTDP-4-amino-4,6-dideoxygalactose transaminase
VVTQPRTVKKRLTVIEDDVRDAVMRVLEREPYYAGPEQEAFEQELASYSDAAHGVAANSGTSCLLLALTALGVGDGDEVIVPTNTFVSVPEAVLWLGATPVFTDVEEDGNLSADIVERARTGRTKAIIPVHMFGHPVDMDPIMALAREHGIWVVEDAAHALGARYGGRRVGALGHVGFFSFAGKSITVCGQAGMAVTDDAQLATAMADIRVHGWKQRRGNVWHEAERLGLNLRTSEILCAIGRVHLRKLDRWTEARRSNAERLNALLAERAPWVVLPKTREDQEPGWLHYVIRTHVRDGLKRHLEEHGVSTGIHYPVPLHRQAAFLPYAQGPEHFPVTERLCSEVLTLPSHPWLEDDDLVYVADTIAGYRSEA